MARPLVSEKYEPGSAEREDLILNGWLHAAWRDVPDVWPILKAQGKEYCERLVVPYEKPAGYIAHTPAGFFAGTCECNDCLNGTGLEPSALDALRRRQRAAKMKTMVRTISPALLLLLGLIR